MRYETIQGTSAQELANKLNALLAEKSIRVISADLTNNSALIEAQDEPTGESVTTITIQKPDGRFFSEVATYNADGSVKNAEKKFTDGKGVVISEDEFKAETISPASDVETPQNTEESHTTAPESASVDKGAGEPQNDQDEALEATLRNNAVNPN
ncbi:MAG: hypothetical protein FMNOHCHN_03653 [Ignavibacteriaceae bacterium]|nr:hypothetical protein [Ignavibacteriaceae bacterium]